MSELARCLSRSCTTGWFDWVHGELWLSPAGLVRRRLSWGESVGNGLGPTVGRPLPEARWDSFDLAGLAAAHATNKVIVFDEVTEARLVRGAYDRRAAASDAGRAEAQAVVAAPRPGVRGAVGGSAAARADEVDEAAGRRRSCVGRPLSSPAEGSGTHDGS